MMSRTSEVLEMLLLSFLSHLSDVRFDPKVSRRTSESLIFTLIKNSNNKSDLNNDTERDSCYDGRHDGYHNGCQDGHHDDSLIRQLNETNKREKLPLISCQR